MVDRGPHNLKIGPHGLENQSEGGTQSRLTQYTTPRSGKFLQREIPQSYMNQKKTHWQGFIAEARNIWQVARYLNPSRGQIFSKTVPYLNLQLKGPMTY